MSASHRRNSLLRLFSHTLFVQYSAVKVQFTFLSLSQFLFLTFNSWSLNKSDVREAHFVYAREIVKMYHGFECVIAAENRYKEIASGRLPEHIEMIEITTKSISIVDLIRTAGFASSNSDARRLILGGGIKINGKPVTDSLFVICEIQELVLSRGKNKFVKVVFK